MPTSRTHRRSAAVTNLRGDRTVTTNIRGATCRMLEAACREQGVTKSGLLRRLIHEYVHLEGHR